MAFRSVGAGLPAYLHDYLNGGVLSLAPSRRDLAAMLAALRAGWRHPLAMFEQSFLSAAFVTAPLPALAAGARAAGVPLFAPLPVRFNLAGAYNAGWLAAALAGDAWCGVRVWHFQAAECRDVPPGDARATGDGCRAFASGAAARALGAARHRAVRAMLRAYARAHPGCAALAGPQGAAPGLADKLLADPDLRACAAAPVCEPQDARWWNRLLPACLAEEKRTGVEVGEGDG